MLSLSPSPAWITLPWALAQLAAAVPELDVAGGLVRSLQYCTPRRIAVVIRLVGAMSLLRMFVDDVRGCTRTGSKAYYALLDYIDRYRILCRRQNGPCMAVVRPPARSITGDITSATMGLYRTYTCALFVFAFTTRVRFSA